MFTFDEYQINARRTQDQNLAAHFKLDHALCGLASEVGEVLGCYQKTYQGHNLDLNKVVDEMGDVLWMLAELSDIIGVPLSSIASRNNEKLMERYPNGFEADRSVRRDEYAAKGAEMAVRAAEKGQG